MASAIEPWTALRLNRAGLVRCEPDWGWSPPARTFTDFDLWHVWAGRGWMDFPDGHREELRPGSLMCLRPGEPPRRAEHDPTDRLGVCYVHFDFLTPGGRAARRLPDSHLPAVRNFLSEGSGRAFVELTLRRIIELSHVGSPAARQEAACYLEGIVRGLCAGLGAAPAAGARAGEGSSLALAEARRRLDQVVRHLRENPAETFSVQAMADRAHYSVDHFSRLFTTVYGRSPKEFCIGVRLNRARLLLTESDLTVDQIARNLGYGDVFFFSRQFKARLGLPPTAWRAATRQ